MKTIKILMASFFLLSLLSACKNDKKENQVTVKEANTTEKVKNNKNLIIKTINLDNSTVAWSGSKLTGKHTGTLRFRNGNVQVKDDKIVGGKFIIDMSTMTCTDLSPDEGGKKLVGHLQSADFFDIAKYPDASFDLTKVTALSGTEGANSVVYGNLTIKDVTKEIGFKANVSIDGSKVNVDTKEFLVDRTDFGLQYGSSKFTDVVKDKAINDKIGITLNVSTQY